MRRPRPDVCLAYFGEACLASYEHLVVRYQAAGLEKLSYGFHQDGNYHTRDPRQHGSLTTWIPLTACGEDAPGLEFVAAKVSEIMPLPKGAALPCLMVDSDYVRERFAADLRAPRFEPGDVLLFDGFTIHRSHITSGMTRVRPSADFRFYAAASQPDYIRSLTTLKIRIDEKLRQSAASAVA